MCQHPNQPQQAEQPHTNFGLLEAPKFLVEHGGKEAAIILANAVLVWSISYLLQVLVPVMKTPLPSCSSTEQFPTQIKEKQ